MVILFMESEKKEEKLKCEIQWFDEIFKWFFFWN